MKKRLTFRAKSFFIKARSWEYWPMWLVYLPAGFYYIYLAIRARSLFFFSAANPSIETGGMFFESKWNIFKLIPKEYYPSTILVTQQEDLPSILFNMKIAGLDFPVIAKPDRGERGWCVKKIKSVPELEQYRKRMPVDFLIQSYVDLPLEFSIFYSRHPGKETGKVSSVTLKKLLTVTGDGYSTIHELVCRDNRSYLQYNKLKSNPEIDFTRIIEPGETEILVPYGNHVLGAMFLDYNHIISDELAATFDHISKQISGFYYGRYDLRCSSIEDLAAGRNIAILELNGAGAEPSHIYNPGFSFFKAQTVIINHYRMMYDAAIANRSASTPFMSFQSFRQTVREQKEYKRQAGF